MTLNFNFGRIIYATPIVTCSCRSGGIGRRTRFKIVRETMRVRVPPSAPTSENIRATSDNRLWPVLLLRLKFLHLVSVVTLW